jgi:hypothetical protein
MNRFSNDRGALDFIASRLVEEAQSEGVAFSDVERKMLYFSETAWTLPDIWDVNDKFDRDYDQDVYERKISQLMKNAVSLARKHQPEEYKGWADAIRHLNKEDRYLLVMVHQARLRSDIRAIFVVEGFAQNSNSSNHRRDLVCWPDLGDKEAFS